MVYIFNIAIRSKNVSPGLKQCEAKALKLSPSDRAMLAHRLISSLDTLESTENERLWIEEAGRRYKAYRKGKISSRSANDAIRDVRAALK
jgi:hypothetical protein